MFFVYRRDHRYDEVSMLESNLKELEIEHQKIQHRSADSTAFN